MDLRRPIANEKKYTEKSDAHWKRRSIQTPLRAQARNQAVKTEDTLAIVKKRGKKLDTLFSLKRKGRFELRKIEAPNQLTENKLPSFLFTSGRAKTKL